MPGRGLVTAAALISIALACLATSRKLEREYRLMRKLRLRGALGPAHGLSLDELSVDERDAAQSLASAGVLGIGHNHCYLQPSELPAFRRKRLRLVVGGAFGALVLACLVALVILRR